jgi:hypothetical protein
VLADQAARSYIAQAIDEAASAWHPPPDAQVEIGARRVHVWIHANLPTAFLRIVRIDAVAVEASAFADVQFGIHDGGGG